MEAFAGESMARNKYTFFASKAKKDGYVQISKIFEETAANEKEHAELWYKYLNGGKISATTDIYPLCFVMLDSVYSSWKFHFASSFSSRKMEPESTL